MPIKIKRSQKRLIALTLTERVKPVFFRLLNKFIKDEILSSIRRGVSPVNKGGVNPKNTGNKARYQKYSDGYVKAMGKGKLSDKRQSPRNLELTGKMLRSIKSRKFNNYLRVWFTDAKAKYHNKLGAGKSQVIRRMVPNPKNGEDFNAGIRRKIINALSGAIKLSKK